MYIAGHGQPYTQIYVQLVFAVQWRQCVIPAGHKEEFYKYIAGIVKGEEQKLMVIFGMPDHVHLLVGLSPEVVLSDFIKKVKAASSRLFNDKRWVARKFNWQRGYGAFSCSAQTYRQSSAASRSQEAYHATYSFKEKFIALLEKHEIEYDPKYLFDLWRMPRIAENNRSPLRAPDREASRFCRQAAAPRTLSYGAKSPLRTSSHALKSRAILGGPSRKCGKFKRRDACSTPG